MRVTVNGIDLACQADGPEDGPVLVLCHTLATSRAMWRRQIPHFARSHRVVSYDMRGHGESAAPDYPYSLEMLGEDVIGILDSLGVERPAVFLGISIGGMVGQALALRHPDRFRALILSNTSSRTPPEGRAMLDQRIEAIRKDGVEGQVQPTLERWLSPEFRARDPETTKWVADLIRATPVTGFDRLRQGDPEAGLSPTSSSASRCRRLVIAGEKDPGASVAAAQAIHGKIKGSQLAVIPGCYHQTPIEAPDAFNRTVDTFLAKLGIRAGCDRARPVRQHPAELDRAAHRERALRIPRFNRSRHSATRSSISRPAAEAVLGPAVQRSCARSVGRQLLRHLDHHGIAELRNGTGSAGTAPPRPDRARPGRWDPPSECRPPSAGPGAPRPGAASNSALCASNACFMTGRASSGTCRHHGPPSMPAPADHDSRQQQVDAQRHDQRRQQSRAGAAGEGH